MKAASSQVRDTRSSGPVKILTFDPPRDGVEPMSHGVTELVHSRICRCLLDRSTVLPGAHANGQHRPGHAVHDEFDADQHADHPKARRGPLPPDGEAQQHRDDPVKQKQTPGRELFNQGDGDADSPTTRKSAASMRARPSAASSG